MKEPIKLPHWSARQDDKRLIISGPCNMELFVDYDDVWHEEVSKEVSLLLEILEKHWPVNE